MFFFSSRRRHTRYWRDWSSDVCSSVLLQRLASQLRGLEQSREALRLAKEKVEQARTLAEETTRQHLEARSEERRVGKECRSMWEANHEEKLLSIIIYLAMMTNVKPLRT